MTDLALVKAGHVRVVESIVQLTLPLAESISVGQAVRLDTTAGKFTKANGTTTSENRIYGILVSKDGAGAVGTAIRKGVLDGYDLTSLNYDAAVYLSDTDGTLADGAGSVSTIVGRVIPAWAQTLGNSPDKLLFVDL